MSGNGSTYSEYTKGGVLPKILPSATDNGPVQIGMFSKSVGGYKKRRTNSCSKKQRKLGGSKRRRSKNLSKKNRKSRAIRKR